MKSLKSWMELAALLLLPVVAQGATIDQMYTATFGHYSQTYDAGGQFMVFSQADHYVLNDQSTWESGAGWHPDAYASLASVRVEGSLVVYSFAPTDSGLLFQNTDYDSGDHSAQGQLGLPTRLEITATLGSRTGTLSGYTQIISNDETWYGQPRFNYYSAQVGEYVSFRQTYTLDDAFFTTTLFDGSFVYNESGVVDFTDVMSVPEPVTTGLLVTGLAIVGWRTRHGRRA